MKITEYSNIKPIGYIGIVDYINELREIEYDYNITEFLDTCEDILRTGFWLDITGWVDLLNSLQEQLNSFKDTIVLSNLVRLRKYIILEYMKRISSLVNESTIHTLNNADDIVIEDNTIVFLHKGAKTIVI